MGFLKYNFIISFVSLFIFGCAPSLIKINVYPDLEPNLQYGKIAERNFFYPIKINPQLIERWETSINGGFAFSSISAYDSTLFVNDLSGRIYCFSTAKGKTLGLLKYKGAVFTTPVIHKSKIIFAVASEKENISVIYFYDFKNGKEIASKEAAGKITNQLVLLDDGVCALSENGVLYKLSFTGEILWQYDTKSFCHSSPSSYSNYIAFGNDEGEIICIGLNDSALKNTSNYKLIYRRKIGNAFLGGTVISENQIFIDDANGKLYSIDLITGSVNWSFNSGYKITMEAVAAENYIYFGNLKGEFFKLSRQDGSIIWKSQTKGLLNITPLLTDNFIILPDGNRKLHFVDKEKGEIIKSFSFDGRLKLNPVIKNNLLFIGYDNGILKAYEINNN